MKLINNHTWGRQKLTSVFVHFLPEKKTRHHEISLPNLHFSFIHYIKLMFFFFFNFKNILYVLFWLTSNFLSLFYDSRLYLFCLGAFSIFLSLCTSKKKKSKTNKKKKSTWVRAPCEDLLQWSIFTSNESFEKAKRTCCFSWLCSCRWKEESFSQLLCINTQSDLGSASESLKTIQPFSTGQFARDPAAECSSFHQVAPLVFTVYGLSSSACLIPLVRINTCFKLLVNKTEHRYECVIKRWENGRCRLLVVFVRLFRENFR